MCHEKNDNLESDDKVVELTMQLMPDPYEDDSDDNEQETEQSD